MSRLKRRALQQVGLIVVLAVVLRIVVLELEGIECRVAPFRQVLFICDMGFFLLPVLLAGTLLVAGIPDWTLAEKRDRIARVCLLLQIPAVVNALLRVADFFLLDCGGDGYVSDESVCVGLYVRILFLSIPTLAAIIFVGIKGVLLFRQHEDGAVV